MHGVHVRAEADIMVEGQTAAAVAAHAPALAAMLQPPEGVQPQLTPFGRLDPPLGLARVKVMRGPPETRTTEPRSSAPLTDSPSLRLGTQRAAHVRQGSCQAMCRSAVSLRSELQVPSSHAGTTTSSRLEPLCHP